MRVDSYIIIIIIGHQPHQPSLDHNYKTQHEFGYEVSTSIGSILCLIVRNAAVGGNIKKQQLYAYCKYCSKRNPSI